MRRIVLAVSPVLLLLSSTAAIAEPQCAYASAAIPSSGRRARHPQQNRLENTASGEICRVYIKHFVEAVTARKDAAFARTASRVNERLKLSMLKFRHSTIASLRIRACNSAGLISLHRQDAQKSGLYYAPIPLTLGSTSVGVNVPQGFLQPHTYAHLCRRLEP